MGDQQTRVDVLSLEDFHAALVLRLGEADTVLATLNGTLACRTPSLGTFADANTSKTSYSGLYYQTLDRVTRLRKAILAAKTATEKIMANYHTAEERNAASATDIAAVLGDVNTVLNEETPSVA